MELLIMRFTLAIALLISSLISSCLCAAAQPSSPHLRTSQGYFAVVRGRAHVEEGALGTYIEVDRPGATRAVAGYIPFGNESTFPLLAEIEGRTIEIGGVVVLDGRALIVLSDPNQLALVG
jgi:hypothetical protein